MYFAMNNITKINVGNYYIGSTTATNTVYGSTVGYSSNFHPYFGLELGGEFVLRLRFWNFSLGMPSG
jgi:hypothetical protein